MIVFSNVTKEFDDRTVLDNVSFTIGPGEFVCITGPSGAGKSTIIHMLIRAEMPTTGSIEVDGADITKLPSSLLQVYRRKTGVVFQDYKLLADRTVYENVAFVAEAWGEHDSVIRPRVIQVLEALGIESRQSAFPHELSGGEKTRVALARALINQPSILIADEPTGNIDPDQSVQILDILREIHASGTTVILATHDKLVVDALGVRVLRLENGKIVRDSVGGYVAENKIVERPSALPEDQAASPEVASVSVALEPEEPPTSLPSPVGDTPPTKEAEPAPKEESTHSPKKRGGYPLPGRHIPKASTRGNHLRSHHEKPSSSHQIHPPRPHPRKKDDDTEASSHGHVKPVEIQ